MRPFGWALMQYDRYLYKKGKNACRDRDAHGRLSCADWTYVATSQGTSRSQRRGLEESLFLAPSEEAWPEGSFISGFRPPQQDNTFLMLKPSPLQCFVMAALIN